MSLHPILVQIDEYLDDLRHHRKRSPKTCRGYRQVLLELLRRDVVLEHNGLVNFIGIREDGQDFALSTRNVRLTIVKEFVGFLRKRGMLNENPVADLESVRVPKDDRPILQVQDLCQALHLLQGSPPPWRHVRDNTIIRLFFYTGIRLTELHLLDAEMLTLEHRRIRGARRKGGARVDILLSDHAASSLEAWLAVRPKTNSKALFINTAGERLSIRMIEKRLKARGEEIGFAVRLHPHAIRHLHATELHSTGSSMQTVAWSMGHSTVLTTQRYIHEDERVLREAHARLPELRPLIPEGQPPTQSS